MGRKRRVTVDNANSLPKRITRSSKNVLNHEKQTAVEMVHEKSDLYKQLEAVLNENFSSISINAFTTSYNSVENPDEISKLKMVDDFTELSIQEGCAVCDWLTAYLKCLRISNDEYISVILFRQLMNDIRTLESNTFRLKIFKLLLMYLQNRPPCNSIVREYYNDLVNKSTIDCEALRSSFVKFNMQRTIQKLLKLTNYIDKKEEYSKIVNFDEWMARDCELVVKLKHLNPKLKLDRMFFIFDVYTELLYLDLKNFVWEKKKWVNGHPIINNTIWGCDTPSINQHCLGVFHLLFHVLPQYRIKVQRYILLIAEAMRLMDRENYTYGSYPYLGGLCKKFAIEFSKGINDIQDDVARKEMIEGIQPPWLKLLVSYCLFTESIILHDFDLSSLANHLNRMTAKNKKSTRTSVPKQSTSKELSREQNKLFDDFGTKLLDKEKSFLLHTIFTAYIEIHHVKDAKSLTFLTTPKEKENYSVSLKNMHKILQKLNLDNENIVQNENIMNLNFLFDELMLTCE